MYFRAPKKNNPLKKLLTILIILISIQVSNAQTFNSSFEVGIAGLGLRYNTFTPGKYLNKFSASTSKGIIVKKSLKNNWKLRIGAESEKLNINHKGVQYYEVADSMNIVGSNIGNKIFAGIEHQWQANNNLKLICGIDAEYSNYNYIGKSENSKSSYSINEKINFQGIGIAPFAGLDYCLFQKFHIGAEINFLINTIKSKSEIEVIKPEPDFISSNSTYLDINPNPLRRVYLTFAF